MYQINLVKIQNLNWKNKINKKINHQKIQKEIDEMNKLLIEDYIYFLMTSLYSNTNEKSKSYTKYYG